MITEIINYLYEHQVYVGAVVASIISATYYRVVVPALEKTDQRITEHPEVLDSGIHVPFDIKLRVDHNCVKIINELEREPTWSAYVVGDGETEDLFRIAIDNKTGVIAGISYRGKMDKRLLKKHWNKVNGKFIR